MTQDTELVDRIRTILADRPEEWTEKSMFGGLGFMIGDHLALSASSRGGLMLRVDPGHVENLLLDPRISPFRMRGRPMAGWLHAAVDAGVAEDDLVAWVEHSLGYAKTLPGKKKSARA